MAWVHLVICLAVLEFLYFGFEVGRARGRYGVKAPATSGNEIFERYFRVHMNTLEMLIVFIPACLIFGLYVNAPTAAGLGAVYIVGRYVYLRGYVRDPAKRELGYVLSSIPTSILLLGAIYGTVRALL
ncbi:MAG TPA: MAPEG family protein [Steroidobacteraceae bacterium]|nr:MAPEG family protein [Steroidobacteraceae bacterium]